MKTIKQIADDLGVSKTAVRKRLTLEVKTKFAETISGVIHISPEGENIIKQGFQHTSPQTMFAEVSANQFPQVSTEVSALIAMLQNELTIKNEQIRDLNARLAESNAALLIAQQSANAEQLLHAGTMRKQLTNSSAAQAESDVPPIGFITGIKQFFIKKNKQKK